MKLHFNHRWILPVMFFAVSSCGEKTEETVETDAADGSTTEKVLDAVKDVVTPEIKASVSVEERAAKLGFSKYLPAETELVFSVYNSKQAADQLQAMDLFKFFAGQMGMAGVVPDGPVPEGELLEEEALDAEQADGDEDAAPAELEGGPNPWTLLGQEVTLAMGDSTGEQFGNLMTFNSRMGFFQARAFGAAAHAFAKNGDMSDFSEKIVEGMEDEVFQNLLKDSESGVALLEKTTMPPIYVAFRAKEGELEQAAQLVNSSMSFFGMAGEMAAPVEVEAAGSTFAGYKLLGAKLAETMEAERESMDAEVGKETVDALLAAVSKKNLIVVTGTISDYVVMMIGGDEASLKLVEKPEDSIVGTSELNFTDPYVGKQLLTVAYGEKEMLESLVEKAGGISGYALGLREGIAEGQELGDTRDIEEMLQMIVEREKALLSMTSATDSGMVAYVENGLKVETIGGYDKGGMDWDAETQLAHLGNDENNLMFLNLVGNAEYEEKMSDYVEVIFETAYAMAMKLSTIESDDRDLAEMKGYMQLFNEKFREDTLGIYEAFSGDFSEGLGQEAAIVVDLEGSMPAIPGVPQVIVDGGKAPRATLIAPVTDREKLVTAWKKINTHTTSVLATVSEMSGAEIPMQKPISSEKDGMTTWFISFPFFQDDFLPSVTVSDDWFAASTSKVQAIDLIGKAVEGGEKGEGVNFYVNFAQLTEYANEMMTLVEENADKIFQNEAQLDNFNREKEEMKQFIKAVGQFESMTWTSKKEDGYVRNSIHFTTK